MAKSAHRKDEMANPLDFRALTQELRRVDLVIEFWAQNADLDCDLDDLPTGQELLDWIKEQSR